MSVRTRTAISRLVALTLGVALCAGCTASGGEEPAPTESSAATTDPATPEPSPSPTEAPPYDGTAAPQMPADMASDSHLGARAAVAYFVDVRHWAFASGDPSELVALCDPQSIFCSDSIESVNENATLGRTVAGGATSFEISSVEAPQGEDAFFTVVGDLSEEPLTVTDPSGTAVESTEGFDAIPFVIYVEYLEPGRWIVRGADQDVR